MLELLFKHLFRSPGKLLALCLVVYLAAQSFFVGVFLAIVAARWVHKHLVLKAKALEAAEADAARELADKAREQAQAAAAQKSAGAATPAAEVATAASPVQRQYAKSAVVIPMKKTGTRD